MRDIMRQRPGAGPPPQFVTSSPEADLPPKYEELGVGKCQTCFPCQYIS